MNPTPNHPDASEVWNAVMRAGRLLCQRPPAAQAALDALEPFKSVTEFSSGSPRLRRGSLMFLRATYADALFQLGHHREAADWYGLAAEVEQNGAFAGYYVDCVVQGSVSSHYARALQCYVNATRLWRQQYLAFRALSYACFVGQNLLRPHVIGEAFRDSRRHRSAFRELQLRAPLATRVDPSDDSG